jgi:hypothetical protein
MLCGLNDIRDQFQKRRQGLRRRGPALQRHAGQLRGGSVPNLPALPRQAAKNWIMEYDRVAVLRQLHVDFHTVPGRNRGLRALDRVFRTPPTHVMQSPVRQRDG